MLSRLGRPTPLALAVTLLVGCGITDSGLVCAVDLRAPSLLIYVEDAQTGDYIAEGTEGSVSSDASEDLGDLLVEMPAADGVVQALGFFHYRDGDYDIELRRSGYETLRGDVRLEIDDRCHAEPELTLTAELTPV